MRLAFVPARPEFVWSRTAAGNYIDEHVFAKLRTHADQPVASAPTPNSSAARTSTCSAFCRPPRRRGRSSPIRRRTSGRSWSTRCCDRPEYADYWGLKWSDLLRNEERTLDRKGVQNFHGWIRGSVAENKPLDQFARELLAARGSTYTNPPANYYRAIRDPVTRGEATAQVFLGVRAPVRPVPQPPVRPLDAGRLLRLGRRLRRVDYKVLENRRTDTNDKHEFVGEQIVFEDRRRRASKTRAATAPSSRVSSATGRRCPTTTSRLDAARRLGHVAATIRTSPRRRSTASGST